MITVSHPTGNANVREAALGLSEAGLLANFYTTIATFPGDLLDYLSNIKSLSEMRRRRYSPKLRKFTKIYPWYEVGRLSSSKLGLHKLITHETGIFSVDSVYKNLDKQVAASLKNACKKGESGIYAYEDGALSSFKEAKRLGIKCLYDLPTGHWRFARKILKPEWKQWPEWAATMSGFQDSEIKLSRKDNELLLADRIFVASNFTAKTLEDFPGDLGPIKVIPYGYPPVASILEYPEKFENRPLKLLFVGRLTQQKGVANLFSAVEPLKNHVSLTLVGHKASSNCPALDRALAKHRWFPTMHHEGVLKLMREHDVLIFPSLFDGFGLVISEAMSQGTPVIATERCAGPDLISHGENGWLVEAASTKALQMMIEELLQAPDRIPKVCEMAIESARRRPWDVYRRELVSAILE